MRLILLDFENETLNLKSSLQPTKKPWAQHLTINNDESTTSDQVCRLKELFSKLKAKMMRKLGRRAKPFQMKFELVHTFGQLGVQGNDDETLSLPIDVKVSYTHSCILVSGFRRIQVFDLHTKQFKSSISFSSEVHNLVPNFLCVEELYEEERDALLLSGTHLIYKYDLEFLLQTVATVDMNADTCLWKSDMVVSPQGIAIEKQLQQAFISDAHWAYIVVLDLKTGELINFIELCMFPYGVAVTTSIEMSGTLYVISAGTNADNCIEIMKRNNDGFYTKKAQFCDYGQEIGNLWLPNGLVFDHKAKNLIVSDKEQQLIQIFTLEGNFVISFKDEINLKRPVGMCLNELTGELLICNFADHTVKVYR